MKNISNKVLKMIATKSNSKVEELIWLEELTKKGDFYYLGLIKTRFPFFISQKYSKVFYICEECNKMFKVIDDRKERNIDCNKLLCQKCSCRHTNKRTSKREKNSETVKKNYSDGTYNYLKEIYSKHMSYMNKTVIRDLNLNRSLEEKEIIKNKKINTWLLRSKEERNEINKKRINAFTIFNSIRHNNNRQFIRENINDLYFLLKTKRKSIYEELTGDNWKNLRKEAYEFFNHSCARCKKNLDNSYFNLHHSIPFILRNVNRDLIVLCHKCHMIVESKFNKKYNETHDIELSRNYSLEDFNDILYYRDSKNS